LTDDRFPLPVNTGRVDGRAVSASRVVLSLVIVVSAVLVLSCRQTETDRDRITHTNTDAYINALLTGIAAGMYAAHFVCNIFNWPGDLDL